ncbi:MAG: N-acetylmuramoyl-L-alanine amidase [Alphaproteobacteria bacterium]|nr:MAG: N-acetylmuramoyl-L-alanine amidase [Alphaproteobacteria bacterium]
MRPKREKTDLITCPGRGTLKHGFAQVAALLVFMVLALGEFNGASLHAASVPIVTDIRLGQHPDKTRIVVDLSEPVDFSIFTLADPYRIVIDLPEVDWQLPFRSGERSAGQVQNIRYNLFKSGTSRLVLDLRQPQEIISTQILPGLSGSGRRIVFDIKSTTRTAFLETAGWPDLQIDETKSPAWAKNFVRRKPAAHVIVLDPGHGGKDPGAVSARGTREADIVLSLAKELRAQLMSRGRYYKVVLTRDEDVGLALRERLAIARDQEASLLISLHADKIRGQPNVRGASVYTLSKTASDEEAAVLARKENRSDILLDVDMSDNSDEVNDILIDLAMRETMNGSVRFARLLMPELAKNTKVLSNNHRYAGFAVLKAPDVPSVLLEMGYLSNRGDEKNLNSKSWRKKIASSIVDAIDRYFGEVDLRQAKRDTI